MTDQSRIPMPDDGPQPSEGGSLFERAGESFGLEGFRPAPVPRTLAGSRRPRVAGRGDAPRRPQASAPAAALRPQQAEPAEQPPRVCFTGEAQALDRATMAARGLILHDGPVTEALEEFRIVRRRVLLAAHAAARAGQGAAAQRVLICSPLPEEGKTFCAINLALAIAAEKDCEVVLVDADVAKPSIPDQLGLTADRGLMDVLADPDLPVEDCVVPTDIDGFYVLPAGQRTATDAEFLASNRTAEVIGRLTRGAPERILVIDSPPALAASPAAELARHVAQTLVIARADRTGQSAIEDALSLLSVCPDIKLLLNAAHFSPSGRRFGAYYGEGR